MSPSTEITGGRTSLNKRLLWALASLIALGVLFWRFPLFHVVALSPGTKPGSVAVNASDSARAFWKDTLLPAADHAISISELWKASVHDLAGARKKFGQSPGMSSITYFLVQ